MQWVEFKQRYLVRFWSPMPAVIAAGILSAYYFGLTGTFWAVTGEFTRWGGHALQLFGLHPETWTYFKIIHLDGTPLDRIDGVMILGMFAGCLAAALWANNVKLRLPRHRIRIIQALLGGMIAGFGARLAMGCNLAAFFTGIPQFSLHAWFFALATAAGTWFGTKVVMLPLFHPAVDPQKVDVLKLLPHDEARTRASFRLGMLVFAVSALWAVAKYLAAPKLGIAMLCGLGFGLLIERAQICFTSAFRDLWLTGRTVMAKAIILGMMASTIGIYSYVQMGLPPKVFWAGPNAAIGGVLFGFGIVLAGGCETGWMYRAVEGQVHYWLVGIGNLIGATLLAAGWDEIAPVLATPYPAVNLLAVFGPQGGLIVTYLLLTLAMAAVLLWERHFFARHRCAVTAGAVTGDRTAVAPFRPDFRLDITGEPCPYPAVSTLETLLRLTPGQILETLSDCPQSINTIPLDARNHGYEVLAVEQAGPTIRYLIRR